MVSHDVAHIILINITYEKDSMVTYNSFLMIHKTCKLELSTLCNGIAPITQLRTCVIKIVTFKGGRLMW